MYIVSTRDSRHAKENGKQLLNQWLYQGGLRGSKNNRPPYLLNLTLQNGGQTRIEIQVPLYRVLHRLVKSCAKLQVKLLTLLHCKEYLKIFLGKHLHYSLFQIEDTSRVAFGKLTQAVISMYWLVVT